MPQRRTQAPEIQPIRAPRATATPVDTYVRPETVEAGRDLIEFARGLGSLAPNLSRAAEQAAIGARDDARIEAERRLNGMTWEEAQEGYRNGSLTAASDPFLNAAIRRVYGVRLLESRREARLGELAQRAGQPDFNVDEFLARAAREDGAILADDKFAAAGYTEAFRGFAATVRQAQERAGLARVVTERNESVATQFRVTLRQAVESGVPIEDTVRRVRALYPGNASILRMEPRDQDKVLVGVLREFAEAGHYEVVRAILDDEREGVGAISGKPELAAEVARIRNIAEARSHERIRAQHIEARMAWYEQASRGELDVRTFRAQAVGDGRLFTVAEAEALERRNITQREAAAAAAQAERIRSDIRSRNEGSAAELLRGDTALAEAAVIGTGLGLAGLTDTTRPRYVADQDAPSGWREETVSVSAEERRREAVSAWLDRSARVALDARESPDATFDREFRFINANLSPGVKHERWESLLAAGAAQASSMTALGQVSAASQTGYWLYQRLRAASPSALLAHTDERTRDFYELARMFERFGGKPADQALQQAAATISDPAYRTWMGSNPLPEEQRSAGHVLPRSWWFGRTAPTNATQVADEILRYTAFLVRVGQQSPQEALKAAQEKAEQIWKPLNNRLVPIGRVASVGNADAFVRQAEAYFEFFVERFGAQVGVTDPEKLSLTTNGSVFRIVNADTGMLLTWTDRPPSGDPDIVTPAFLHNWFRDAGAVRAAERAAQRRRLVTDPPQIIAP